MIPFILANWKWLLGAVASVALSVALVITTHRLDSTRAALKAEQTAHALDIANWKAASAKARADNLAHVRDIENRDAAIREKQNAQITDDAAHYRDLAVAYSRLHSAATAHRSDPGGAGISEASNPSSGAPAALGDTIVPLADLERCADAYAVAVGWQRWYGEVSAAPR